MKKIYKEKIIVDLKEGVNAIPHNLKREVYSLVAFYENKLIQLDWYIWNEIDEADSITHVYIKTTQAYSNVTLKIL